MSAPFAISCGDPAGIGPEIIAKAWALRSENKLPPFFVVGDAAVFEQLAIAPVARIEGPGAVAAAFDRALPVLHVHSGEPVVPGEPTLDGAQCALHALEMACGMTRAGEAGAMITAPVAKSQLYKIGFTFPGQTEFVSERCGIARANAVMMLAGPSLRVIPITTHIPLMSVGASLTIELILARVRTAHKAIIRNFGIAAPRIAVAGLNPHAGEDGAMGREEVDIIAPAVALARAEGLDVTGPLAADTMFHDEARAAYDVALCPTHDQALIPLKTLHFFDGVNMTLGLPIVRTSPDHGTAFALAGKNRADPRSMIAAIQMAQTAVTNRARHDA
jgi:4-hydroxythreonine-4-phosphate dehydrogenase